MEDEEFFVETTQETISSIMSKARREGKSAIDIMVVLQNVVVSLVVICFEEQYRTSALDFLMGRAREQLVHFTESHAEDQVHHCDLH